MKTRKNSIVQGLLLDNSQRPAGSMVNNNGETISWGDAYKITFLPLEESKTNSIRKLTVSDDAIKKVEETLAEVHWGALISLSLESNKVIGVTVDYDLLAAHFEYEG